MQCEIFDCVFAACERVVSCVADFFSTFWLRRSNINTRHYDSVSEVVADVLQMYENCELYNEDASAVGREASRQRSEFKRFCKKNHLPQ